MEDFPKGAPLLQKNPFIYLSVHAAIAAAIAAICVYVLIDIHTVKKNNTEIQLGIEETHKSIKKYTEQLDLITKEQERQARTLHKIEQDVLRIEHLAHGRRQQDDSDNIRDVITQEKFTNDPFAPPADAYGGLGLSYKYLGKDGLEIAGLMHRTPAHKAGFFPGDRIIAIDGEPVSEMSKEEATERMRGPAGSAVELSFIPKRAEGHKVVNVTLIREMVTPPTIPRANIRISKLIWDVPDDERRIIITPDNSVNGSLTATFKIRNEGDASSPPLHLNVVGKNGSPIKMWRILPESTCLTQKIEPQQHCTIVVRATAQADGQMNAYIHLGDRGPTNKESTLIISSYAKGISGKLPAGVVGNGDTCPAADSRAEIAVSIAEKGRGEGNGFFDMSRIDSKGKVRIVTADCLQWRTATNGALYCNNPGEGHHTATQREYSANGIDGPWEQTNIDERSISPTLICKNGVIDQIDWRW